MSGPLRVQRAAGVARVTLARPEVRNALNAELIETLTATFLGFLREPDDELRAVVLAGDGPVFCAGADVEWQRASIDLSLADNQADAARLQVMLSAVDECPVPVIARVHGAALGGGMGLCCVADIVVAEAGTTFGFTETKLGILPAIISSFVLARIGEGQARALFLTGERFAGRRAREIGLVHELAPDQAALDARVEAILTEVAASGPTAVREAKALLRRLRTLPPAEARSEVIRVAALQRTSPEGQEGLRAFLEKRLASWRRP